MHQLNACGVDQCTIASQLDSYDSATHHGTDRHGIDAGHCKAQDERRGRSRHDRLASRQCGFPEIKLDLLPGAGGTQRRTRVVGPEKALEMLLTGEPLPAQECLELGLIGELITEFDFHDDAISFARKLIAEQRPLRRVAT